MYYTFLSLYALTVIAVLPRAASGGDPAPYPYSSSRATMVNFGKHIKNQSKPEWEPYYLNYNGLKELIKVRS